MSFKCSWHWLLAFYLVIVLLFFPLFCQGNESLCKSFSDFLLISRDTCINNRLFKMLSISVCWFVGKSRIFKRGESLLRVKSNKHVKWGAEGVCGRGDSQIRKVEDTLPTSQHAGQHSSKASTCQKQFLSLSHFPRHRATFMNLDRQPSFLLYLHSLFVSVLSLFPGAWVSGSRSNGIVCLYRSTSIATTAAVKGNRTEVPGTLLCLFLFTLPLSCYPFYSLSLTLANWSLFPPLYFISPLYSHHLSILTLSIYFIWNAVFWMTHFL